MSANARVFVAPGGGKSLMLIRVILLPQFGLYALILSLGIYWAYYGHWVYLWDELLWIFGFAFMEVNLEGWRDEIDNEVADDLSS